MGRSGVWSWRHREEAAIAPELSRSSRRGSVRTNLALVAALAVIVSACGGTASSATAEPVATTGGAATAAPSEAAPSTGGETPLEPVELSYWTEQTADPGRSFVEEQIKRFEALHPGVTITHRPLENEQFFTALRAGFTSGNPPDIFQHEANNNLFQFVTPGQVDDISDWFTQPGNGDRFLPGTDKAVTYDGKQYGVPTSIHTGTQLYYNKKLLADQGIDPTTFTTWDEYLAAFEQLKAAGTTPIAFANKFGWPGSQWFFAFLVRWAGSEKVNQLVARNCDYKWTDADIVQAAQLYVDLAQKGYFSKGMASDDYPSATATFFSGKAAFFHTGSWFIAETLEGAPPDFELGIVKFPAVTGGKGTQTEGVVAVLGGQSISKVAGEDPAKRAAAVAFLDFMTSLDEAQAGVKELQNISTVVGAVNADTADANTLQIIQDQVEGNTGAVGYIEHLTPKAVGEDAIWMGGVGVLTGQLDAQSWMQSVEDAAAAEPASNKIEPQCP